MFVHTRCLCASGGSFALRAENNADLGDYESGPRSQIRAGEGGGGRGELMAYISICIVALRVRVCV